MKKQKERARAERLKKNISGWSEDLFGGLTAEPTVFTGYDTLNDNSVVVALSDEETLTDAIATDEQAKEGVLVVLDKTPSMLRWAAGCRPRRAERCPVQPACAGREKTPRATTSTPACWKAAS